MSQMLNLGEESHYIFPDEINEKQKQHPLLQGLFVSRAGHFRQNESFLTHRPNGLADSHILIYCISGEGWFESQGQRWKIQAGDMLFVLANEPHAYASREDDLWEIQWVHFNGHRAAAFLALISVTPNSPVVHVGHQFKLVAQFNEILVLCQLGYSLFILIQIGGMFRQILSRVALDLSFAPSNQKGLDVEKTIQLMQERISTNLSVSELATAVNLSESHFSRQFHSKTGYSPLDYFIRLKMQRACDRLYATDLPIQEIGRSLGYSDPYYFSRLFKKTIGVSPRQFRHQKTGS